MSHRKDAHGAHGSGNQAADADRGDRELDLALAGARTATALSRRSRSVAAPASWALVEHARTMVWRAAIDAQRDDVNAAWPAFTGRVSCSSTAGDQDNSYPCKYVKFNFYWC
jgi:hypothetical protein